MNRPVLIILVFVLSIFNTNVFSNSESIIGIELGDSLLNWYDEKEIKDYINKNKHSYKLYGLDYSFQEVVLLPPTNNSKSMIKPDYVGFFVKPDDRTYQIYSIVSMTDYPNNFNECVKNLNNISKRLKSKHKILETITARKTDEDDNVKGWYYISKSGIGIELSCTDLTDKRTKETNVEDNLTYAIDDIEFTNWFYKQ